ncbi:ABC transporter substrate-binding protein [Chelatococcus reniformis]|uniref:ABC transporter substrate-binding protein n=2 Tax=Chelatococcus reniformis TaxID=1494448 RepID=A0A916U8L0_9HYPH|nr:ABC transporter substrate-binding protein [Chelatococcus reniformis]
MSELAMRLILGLLLVVALALPAAAHPHVWVSVRSEIIYAPGGSMTGVRHSWTFDKAYSAYSVQGLDKNGDGKVTTDELAELAKVNTESLNEYGYFTHARVNGKELEFAEPADTAMEFTDGQLTLRFLLPLKKPLPASRALMFDVSDPTYFVDFNLADGADPVRLAGAPAGCTLTVMRPKAPAPDARNLSESFFTALDQSSDFGTQFANKALVACP